MKMLELKENKKNSIYLTSRQREGYNMLCEYLESNNYKAGDKIPSFKILARELKLSLGVLKKITDAMADKGIIETIPYVGTFMKSTKKEAEPKLEQPANSSTVPKPLIAVVMPYNTPEIMDSFHRSLQNLGFGMMVMFTPAPDWQTTKNQLLMACSHGVAGIIFLTTANACESPELPALISKIQTSGIQVISIPLEPIAKDTACIDITFDFEDIIDRYLTHLVLKGCKTLYFLRNQEMDPWDRLIKQKQDAHNIEVIIKPDIEYIDKMRGIIQKSGNSVAILFDSARSGLRLLDKVEDLEVDLDICCVYDILLQDSVLMWDLGRYPINSFIFPFKKMVDLASSQIMEALSIGKTRKASPPALPLKLMIRNEA